MFDFFEFTHLILHIQRFIKHDNNDNKYDDAKFHQFCDIFIFSRAPKFEGAKMQNFHGLNIISRIYFP